MAFLCEVVSMNTGVPENPGNARVPVNDEPRSHYINK